MRHALDQVHALLVGQDVEQAVASHNHKLVLRRERLPEDGGLVGADGFGVLQLNVADAPRQCKVVVHAEHALAHLAHKAASGFDRRQLLRQVGFVVVRYAHGLLAAAQNYARVTQVEAEELVVHQDDACNSGAIPLTPIVFRPSQKVFIAFPAAVHDGLGKVIVISVDFEGRIPKNVFVQVSHRVLCSQNTAMTIIHTKKRYGNLIFCNCILRHHLLCEWDVRQHYLFVLLRLAIPKVLPKFDG
mmetsp:Transcript_9469/g.23690  ORF Transcript_9469/g.23690 Transcript_9469/m.23690 type:complete len:244 (+) Transcript_9469:191-922(+)